MKFMNEYEIRESVETMARFPVRHHAAKLLVAYMEQVNEHSDGWPYWSLPVKAAAKLMSLVGTHWAEFATDATQQEFTRALAPIKSFYTRRGNAAGMSLQAEWLNPPEQGAQS